MNAIYAELHDAVIHSAHVKGEGFLLDLSHVSVFIATDSSEKLFNVWSYSAQLEILGDGNSPPMSEETISEVEGLQNVLKISAGVHEESWLIPVQIKFLFSSGETCSFSAEGFRFVLGKENEWLEEWEGPL